MAEWIAVARVDDVVEGEPFAASAGGAPIALFQQDGAFFALYDLCSHGQARLSDGFVEDGCVECPLHQGLVEIRSGLPKSAPIVEAIRSFPTRVVGDAIEILF